MVSLITVNISRGRLPLGITVPSVRNLGESVGDVRVQTRSLGKVKLVPGAMGVGTAGMASLGSSGDGNTAATGLLQSDGALDRVLPDAVIGSAFRIALSCAATAGRGVDAGSFKAGLSLRLGEGADSGRGKEGGDEDGELHNGVETVNPGDDQTVPSFIAGAGPRIYAYRYKQRGEIDHDFHFSASTFDVRRAVIRTNNNHNCSMIRLR